MSGRPLEESAAFLRPSTPGTLRIKLTTHAEQAPCQRRRTLYGERPLTPWPSGVCLGRKHHLCDLPIMYLHIANGGDKICAPRGLGAIVRGMDSRKKALPRGRGAAATPPNRFERLHLAPESTDPEEENPDPKTHFLRDHARSIISTNESPTWAFPRASIPTGAASTGALTVMLGRPTNSWDSPRVWTSRRKSSSRRTLPVSFARLSPVPSGRLRWSS